MSKKIVCAFIIYFSILNSNHAQSSLAYEIGIIAGPSILKSDFGERHDSSTNFGNNGFGVGFVHYTNFAYNSGYYTYLKEHVKVRIELSFNNTQLEHFGKWVDNSKGLAHEQLKNMEGKTFTINHGIQLEYYPFQEISVYERNIGTVSPYLSFGAQYNYYMTKVYSTNGTLGTAEATFPKYLVPSDGRQYGFSSENKSTWSLVYGAGIRYNLSPLSDLVLDGRLQYFGSDWVDGVNPNKGIYTENKYNDWQIWMSFGYIYYIE